MSGKIDMIKSAIERHMTSGNRVLVAIDGNCTAGKTTLAALLQQEYDCNLFHMDDFFLQPHQRTVQRYAEIGGNVDYERFRAEVLMPLKQGSSFTYRPFNCKTLEFSPEVAVMPKQLNIIEGSYSLHPYFEDPYDLKVFLSVTEAIQIQRVKERPAFLHQAFFEKWIPMENRYFGEFRIREKCHLIF